MMHTWFVKIAYVSNISIQKKCYNCPVTLYGTWSIMDWHGLTNNVCHNHLLKKIKKMQYWTEEGKLLSVYITSKAVCFSNVWSVSIMHIVKGLMESYVCLFHFTVKCEAWKTCTTESFVNKPLKFINTSWITPKLNLYVLLCVS